MSAREERQALTSRTPSLHDYALFRHGIEPDGRIPSRGFPLPGEFPEIDEDDELAWEPAEAAVGAVLAPLLADPDTDRAAETAQLQLASLPVEPTTVHRITYWIGRRLAPDDPVTGTARCLARRLARTGTHPAAVHAGLGLLIRLGEAEDVPLLRTLGMLEDFADPAVEALDRIDRHAAALVWLTRRGDEPRIRQLIDAVHFEWLVPDDGSSPQAQADAAIRRLAAGDPRFLADLRHARREDAEALGFPWPEEEEA
ncbi:hypothetical protein [Streptomyces sp. NRRL S-378]|uniref:hypothetical protein n=1 Tax=Streptomyces sp. NRRL S-378 TaxID=1463904 RepID=UPI00068F2A60|nr:hypothetical protein [Streptomyces sp. NRRL S-378]